MHLAGETPQFRLGLEPPSVNPDWGSNPVFFFFSFSVRGVWWDLAWPSGCLAMVHKILVAAKFGPPALGPRSLNRHQGNP